MKTIRLYNCRSALVFALLLAMGCTDEKIGPVLQDTSTFVAPSIKNAAASSATVELLPANAANEFEKFEWNRTQYGLQLSTNYVLQVDKTADFTNPQVLAETSSDNASVTVEKFNAALLALGLPGFQDATVHIRVKSTLNGIEKIDGKTLEPLYSEKITRTVKTYQNSECGKYCTVGIIGSATPGGWSTDTDLRIADPAKVDKSVWTTTLYLAVGEVKFREGDDWAINWGSTAFPNGTGTQNGANIPIATAGYYKVTFNENTGAYTFTAQAAPVYTTVGIIGSATAGGWNSDTDLTKDPNNPHVWTGTVTLTAGEAKFRAEDAWTVNWGSNTAPTGFGVGNGANIPVGVGGTYFVRFHDVTGEYSLMAANRGTPFATVGIIGPAQSGGWNSDTDMVQNPSNPYLWSKVITLSAAEAKFRADNDWAVNWGAASFPGGVATQNGNNIPVKAGKYFVTLNTGTGEYYFLK